MKPSRVLGGLTLGLLAFGLVGCWDVEEVDRREFISAVGLDAVSGATIRVTLQAPVSQTVTPSAARQTGGSGQAFFTISTDARTVIQGIANLQASSFRNLHPGHVRSIIVQEDLARQGTLKVLDHLARLPKLPPNAKVFVSPVPTETLLRQKSMQEMVPGLGLDEQTKASQMTDQTYAIPLWRFFQRLDEWGIDPYASLVTYDQEKQLFITTGLAVFSRDRLAGLLNSDQTRVYGLMSGKSGGGILEVPLNGRRTAGFRMVRARSRIRALNPELSRFAIQVSVSGYLVEIVGKGAHDLSTRELSDIESQVARHIEGLCREALSLLQTWRSDILGLGLVARIHYPGQYDAKTWHDRYETADIDVQATFHITRTGLFY